MLVRPVIVGTVGNRGAKPVRAHPRAHQLVGRRFRRTVRTRRLVWRTFGESAWIVERKVAVHFVGADVVESNIVAAGGLEQHVRAGHVRIEEWGGVENRIIVMRFGGEVHNGVNRGYCGC